MEKQEIQQKLMDFERNRVQLVNISNQKQQLQFQNNTLKKAVEELGKTKEKKVYKAIGNILILSDVEDVKKEISEQAESLELRVKTLQKQEDALMEKLNKLKTEIESATGQKVEAEEDSQDSEESENEEKKEDKK